VCIAAKKRQTSFAMTSTCPIGTTLFRVRKHLPSLTFFTDVQTV